MIPSIFSAIAGSGVFVEMANTKAGSKDWYLDFELSGVYKPGDKDSQYKILLGKIKDVALKQQEAEKQFNQSKNLAGNMPKKIVPPSEAAEGNEILKRMLDPHKKYKQEYILVKTTVELKLNKARIGNTNAFNLSADKYDVWKQYIDSKL